MYKVDYYTLGKYSDGSVGNIKQFSDIWYTEQDLDVLQKELERIVDIKYDNKYVSVITSIELIKGHGSK